MDDDVIVFAVVAVAADASSTIVHEEMVLSDLRALDVCEAAQAAGKEL